MDKQTIVQPYNGILSAIKRNKLISASDQSVVTEMEFVLPPETN